MSAEPVPTSSEQGFSARAWAHVQPWYEAVLTHPFVTALLDGSLDADVFARYLVDDAHYLAGYGRALALAAARAPDTDGLGLLAGAAQGAVLAERVLHREHLAGRGLDPDATGGPEPTPTCLAYLHTLVADAALAPVGVAVAGLLPCFRVYAEVGAHVAARATGADHPYRAWVDTYADPDFAAAVRSAEQLADRLAVGAHPDEQQRMLVAYERSVRFEWMFWEASWRGEGWPAPNRKVMSRVAAPLWAGSGQAPVR